MKIETVMGCLILAAVLAVFIIPMVMMLRKKTRLRVRYNALGDGEHHELSLKADAAITTRFLLVKRGSDANHAAVCAAASDEPLGLCTDEADAAEDSIAVKLLGVVKGTVLMVAQGVIAADVDVYSYGDGTITVEPTTAGTFWRVGKSRTAGAAALEMEVEPCRPEKVIVLAALTCTNGTAGAAADLSALKAEMELATDDLRRIAAALATPCRVKILAA